MAGHSVVTLGEESPYSCISQGRALSDSVEFYLEYGLAMMAFEVMALWEETAHSLFMSPRRQSSFSQYSYIQEMFLK